MRTTEQITQDLLSCDGTVPAASVSAPTSGYVVGINGHGIQYREEASPEQVAEWVSSVRTRAAQPSHYLGSWQDAETGVRYLDLVRVFGERAVAEAFGREQGEIAIFDLRKGEEIRL